MLKFVNKEGKLALIWKDNGEIDFVDASLKESIKTETQKTKKEDEQNEK